MKKIDQQKPQTIHETKLPNTPKLHTVSKLHTKTPCSQKRKLSYDMELETPNSHSKTRLLNASESKGENTSAKHDFQVRTKLQFKNCEDFLDNGGERYELKPPWENQNSADGNQGRS